VNFSALKQSNLHIRTDNEEIIMLQANEIAKRFQHLQSTIDEAQRALQSSQDTPQEIRSCIDRLSQEYRQAQPVIASNDQNRIAAAVDKLEDMGDEAKRLSRNSPQVPPQVEAAVKRVHDELSDFKHKLH
jgi:methyl-accepting chemotaxis protein